MHFDRCMLVAAAALTAVPGIAGAQNQARQVDQDAADRLQQARQDERPDGAAEFKAWRPEWPSDEIETLSMQLAGAWKTTSPIDVIGGEQGDTTDVIMIIQPAPVEGLPGALYAESYRTDDPANPYRQSVMQFYDAEDGVRLRTFELSFPEPFQPEMGPPQDWYGVFEGMGLATEAFPRLIADDLIATLDFEITKRRRGFEGSTPHPYPTAKGGAVSMTSEIEVSRDTMRIADRGFAADGSVAWGAGGSASYSFERTEPHIDVTRMDNGLISLDFVRPEGEPIAEGGRLHVDYRGWLRNGIMFDSSLAQGRDTFVFNYPPRLIEGWNVGLEGVTTGTVRKLVIPGDLAYGQRGQPRAEIPPNAPLYFTIEVKLAEQPDAPDEQDEADTQMESRPTRDDTSAENGDG